jgi:subtilisin family serine protease
MDGYQKPDLCAPGADSKTHGINSSVSRNATGTNLDVWTSHMNAFSGTSQAAPHVAGTIALMLQKNDSLSVSEIKTILRQAAVNDSFVGAVPNYRWGFGKLNATAAVQLVLLYIPLALEIPWWVWVIIIGTIVLVIVLVVVIRKKKKRSVA